jgi:hypothetical protein
MRVRFTTLATLCLMASAACNSSSPTAVDSEAGKASKLTVSPLVINFGNTATTASVTITNSTKRAMSWSASESAGWLSLGATSGTVWGNSSRTFSVSAERSGLATGTYTTDLKFTGGAGAGSEVVPVSVTVPSTGASPAQLSVSPLQVDFGTSGTTASVTLSNTGDSSLTWTASESAGWLSLGATSGSIAGKSSKTLSLSAQRSGMTAGTYTTGVMVSAGAAGSVTETVSMTVPTEPEPDPAPSVLLSGTLVDQFDGHALAGINVQFAGVTATTDASGSFTLSGAPTSTLREMTLSGSGVYRRQTFAKTGDTQWRVVPSSFNMSAYNDVARDDWGSYTVRWTSAPTVYVDTRPEGFEGGDELQRWISEVQSQAAAFVSKWTGSTISPGAVIVTSNPPRDFTGGTIVIHFSEDNSRYGNSTSTIGYARVSRSSSGSIAGSAVWLRYLRYSGSGGASKRTGILGHELGHAMGMGHMTSGTPSFMTPSIGTNTDLSAFDRQAALFLYTRSPGNSSPDTDSSSGFTGSLSPSRASGSAEWVCQDEAERP